MKPSARIAEIRRELALARDAAAKPAFAIEPHEELPGFLQATGDEPDIVAEAIIRYLDEKAG